MCNKTCKTEKINLNAKTLRKPGVSFISFSSSSLSSSFSSISLCLLAIFFIFLFSSLSFATVTCPHGDTDCPSGQVCKNGVCTDCKTSAECASKTFLKSIPGGGGASPWFVIALMAAMVGIMGAGIYFVIGFVFNVDSVKRTGKAEIMQALASLILVGLLFGVEVFEYKLMDMVERQTGIVTATLYNPSLVSSLTKAGATVTVNPFDICYAFLRKLIDCAENQWKVTLASSIGDEILANLQLQLYITTSVKTYPSPIEWANFVPAFAKKVAEKEYLADELSWLMVMLYAQINLFRFIETSMFTVFLPIGIILRAFPPTRGAGAVMIAIAIGLYIVYPLVYTILYIGGPKTVQGCSLKVPSTTSVETASCPLAPGTVASSAGTAASESISMSVDIPVVTAGTGELRYLAYMYLLISLGTTFIFIRSISGMLGADISEMGRSMMKLV